MSQVQTALNTSPLFSPQDYFKALFITVANAVQGQPGRIVCAALSDVVQAKKDFTAKQQKKYSALSAENFLMRNNAGGAA